MKYIRLFLLYMQDVFEYRSIAFVWFLVSIINPLLYLFYWQGALPTSSVAFTSSADVASYYFLYLILGGLLMTHIEHEVAYRDIKEGGLVKYILKPLPYIIFKFFTEFTWRILMGFLSFLSYQLIVFFSGALFTISLSPVQIGVVIISMILGLFISFVFKMIVGLSALWVVEFNGMEQTIFVASLIFSGNVIPLDMGPTVLETIAYVTPFPYIVYYPLRMMQGAVSLQDSFFMVGHQILWLMGLVFVYKYVWGWGVKKFTGVGL